MERLGNKIIVTAFAVSIWIFLSPKVMAQDYSALYDQLTLQTAHATYRDNLRGMWQEDLLANLSSDQRQKLTGIRLNLPLVGNGRHMFDFYADPETGDVVIPILSVKFFDDLATTLAWMERKGCDKERIYDYVAMLRYQGSVSLTGGPRKTFRVPSNVFDDTVIYNDSGKILKATLYFIAAHEAAHVLYQHLPTSEAAQRQETEADLFALDLMTRIGVAPIALPVFFSLLTAFEPVPADFQSLDDYKATMRQRATHPLSSERVRAVAHRISQQAERFSQTQPNPTEWRTRFLLISQQIAKIADIIDSKEIRRDLKRKGQTTTAAQLAIVCQ